MTTNKGSSKKLNKKFLPRSFERLSQPLPGPGKARALVTSHFYDTKLIFLILTNEKT